MRVFRLVAIWVINRLPIKFKWMLFLNNSFLHNNLYIDFLKLRKELLNNCSKIIVIGANDGLSFDDLFQDINSELTEGILIEPSSRYFEQLVINIKNFPRLKAVKVALANEESLITLFQLNDSGLEKMPDWGSGLGSFSKDHLLKFGNLSDRDLEEELVEGKPFKWLVQAFDLYSVDYLQIDTEGFDSEIIKMIDFEIFSSKIIKFEIANLTKPEILDVSYILESNGYFLQKLKGDMIAYCKKVDLYFH